MHLSEKLVIVVLGRHLCKWRPNNVFCSGWLQSGNSGYLLSFVWDPPQMSLFGGLGSEILKIDTLDQKAGSFETIVTAAELRAFLFYKKYQFLKFWNLDHQKSGFWGGSHTKVKR